jgi:hypothetical protein
MRTDLKIVKARITAQPQSMSDPLPEVWITLEDGRDEKLFHYYPDEISFQPEEFVGLTPSEGRALKLKKDRDFLTS